MSGVYTVDSTAPTAMLLQLDAILAYADNDARIACLSSLLCFYLEQLGGAIDITVGGYRILICGPNQSATVEFCLKEIVADWNQQAHDNYRDQDRGAEW